MKYNYVLFDSKGEYYRVARHELEQLSNVRVRFRELASGGKLKKSLFRLHTAGRINRKWTVPFQRVWNKSFIGNLDFEENNPICFVFTAGLGRLPYQMRLFSYLRQTYPGCKLVLLIRDLLIVTKRLIPEFDLENAKKIYDEIYTINRAEAEKYGLKLMHSFCSRYPVEASPEDEKSDVIFVGVVKDRLDTVRRAYERFTAAGLKCDFLLVSKNPIENVPEGLLVRDTGISYEEMLRRTVNSKCILEVTQKDADGLTSRCLEALCYNKKLISDNFRIKETRYYDPRYMCLFEDIDEVDPEFIKEEIEVDYNYDGDFSPVKGFELIDTDLSSGENKGKDDR